MKARCAHDMRNGFNFQDFACAVILNDFHTHGKTATSAAFVVALPREIGGGPR